MQLGSASSFAPAESVSPPHARSATPPGTLPRVSVALCAYNGERFLRDQLDSLLAQEDVELEVVIVDDGSTDGSLALLREYAVRDPRIRVVANEQNLGHLKSFAKCMALCSHALIAPSDQDDLWHPRKLATLAAAIGDADMAYCNSAYIDAAGTPLGRGISDDLKIMHSGRDPMKYVFQNTVSGHALLVRREVFDAALPFPELLYHDWWLAIRAAAGNGVVYVDQPLVQFRRHVSADSPLGKKKLQTRRERKAERKRNAADSKVIDQVDYWPGSPDRRWVEERLYLFHAIGGRDWRGSVEARTWESALRAAMAGDQRPLFRATWHERRSLPPFKGMAWFNALQFFKRSKRRLRRAMHQQPVPGKLFRA
jgi:glycosyltransferase involved in cell wall biosynthesis